MNSSQKIREFFLLRREIDKITRELVRLVAKRNKIVSKISKIKKKIGLPITDLKRERELLEKSRRYALKMRVDVEVIEKIMKILIRYAKNTQKKEREN